MPTCSRPPRAIRQQRLRSAVTSVTAHPEPPRRAWGDPRTWTMSATLQTSAFVCGILLSVFLGYWAIQRNDFDEDLRFESDAGAAAHAVESRLLAYTEMLRGMAALFAIDEKV